MSRGGEVRTEDPWIIPASWEWTNMGSVSDVVGGGTPSTKVPDFWSPPEISWLTPKDLSNYTRQRVSAGARGISRKGLKSSSATLLPAGTVLFSSRAPIGYVAIAARPLATNQGFKSFVLRDGVLSEYVYHYLKGNVQLALALAGGTTFSEISGSKAAQIPLALPPTSEQARIAATLESLLSRLDAAEDALEDVQRSLAKYRASTFKAACEGRLVVTESELSRRTNRSYEEADVLLERVLAERRRIWEAEEYQRLRNRGKTPYGDEWKAKYQSPTGADEGALPSVPEGWTWATVDQVSTEIRYGHTASATDDTEGPRFLRITDIQNGRVRWDEVPGCDITEDEIKKYRLRPGDLLFARTGATTGKSYLVRDPPSAVFASYLIRVRVEASNVLPEYVYAFFQSPQYWAQIERDKRGVGQPNVNATVLSNLEVPIPPLAEQRRIAVELDRRISIITRVENEVRSQRGRVSRLRIALYRRAFEGRLVPQDPADEAAQVLLERIRAGDDKASSKQVSLKLES